MMQDNISDISRFSTKLEIKLGETMRTIGYTNETIFGKLSFLPAGNQRLLGPAR